MSNTYSLEQFGDAVNALLTRMDVMETRIISLQESKDQGRYLTVKDVSTLFKITKPTLYNWITKGLLTRHRIGSRVYFIKSEVDVALVELRKYKHQ